MTFKTIILKSILLLNQNKLGSMNVQTNVPTDLNLIYFDTIFSN